MNASTQHGEQRQPRREKLLWISADVLLGVFLSMNGKRALKCTGLPPDAKVVCCSTAVILDELQIALRIESATFPEVDPNSTTPTIEAAISVLEFDAADEVWFEQRKNWPPVRHPDLLADAVRECGHIIASLYCQKMICAELWNQPADPAEQAFEPSGGPVAATIIKDNFDGMGTSLVTHHSDDPAEKEETWHDRAPML
jgi:hypothetical protein